MLANEKIVCQNKLLLDELIESVKKLWQKLDFQENAMSISNDLKVILQFY